MQHTYRQSHEGSSGAQASHHSERISVAQIVAEMDHGLQEMLIYQSADAFAFVGGHRWKQFKGKLSSAVAQSMGFGDTAHAVAQEKFWLQANSSDG
jgi:hypothetical protein